MCWENRGLGSPAGPGLSMVVPVNWMVSRKIWINWSCEMVWPDALGIRGMPCGSRYWAGNLLSILSLSLCRAWLRAVSQRRPLNMTQTAFVERAGRE